MAGGGKTNTFRAVLYLAYAAAFAVIVSFGWSGSSYYLTPLVGRPRHVDYWSLKPGGDLGQLFGIVGSTMMVLLLGYSLRKRLAFLRGWGPLSRWLDVHIFFGVVGPLLVILHSSFKVSGLVALSFWSMITVATSGVFGRYLYQQIPKSRAGDRMTLAQITEIDGQLTHRLREEFKLDQDSVDRIEELTAPAGGPNPSLFGALVTTVVSDFALRWKLRGVLRATAGSVPPTLVTQFREVTRQKALLQRRIVLWNRTQELFHYWHVLHKPFALVMYLFMAVHIMVALWTGYGFPGVP